MDNIFVTQPYLPDLEEFLPYLQQIWKNKWLTNNGPFHQQFEKELSCFFGVPHVSLFSNATIALMVALKALDIKGEVITTPYSFIATSHSIVWNNLKPVFVDIDPINGNLDPEKIEKAITKNTTAIMPVHVYGHACNVERIQEIATAHNLKIIYDAAHAFGVNLNGNSIVSYGDLSVVSFHATKIFNTFEGGAIFSKSEDLKKKIDLLKNFGIEDETTVNCVGLNGKMTEYQSAFGILQLKHFEEAKQKRKLLYNQYQKHFETIPQIRFLKPKENCEYNYSYFPVFIENKNNQDIREAFYVKFRERGVIVRKYFFPLISNTSVYNHLESALPDNLPSANLLANEVLCLPIFTGMSHEQVNEVLDIFMNIFHLYFKQ